MKKTIVYAILIIIIWIIFISMESCLTVRQQASLMPPDKRPVFSVAVEDGTEAAILQQQLKLDVVKMEGNRLYYYDQNNNLATRLNELGYGEIISEQQQQVHKKYVKLLLPKSTDTTYQSLATALTKQQIQVINRESDHWVIYGTLAALNNLKKSGNILQNLTAELRPREVTVYVTAVADVQKVSNLGVDIFSTERVKTDSNIIIHGAAYDYQIDSARAMRFRVTISK